MHQRGGIQHFFSMQSTDFMPFYADVFSRDRFNQIHRMLHVQPSADDDSARRTRGTSQEYGDSHETEMPGIISSTRKHCH